MKAAELRALGMTPVPKAKRTIGREPHALPTGMSWPITFLDPGHSIAQNYVQHQDYGTGQYYHGGCDLRTRPGSEVHAPTGGRIEANYYGYENLPTGDSTKWVRAWDGHPTPSLYFEIAVVTDDGFRLEFHHVNPMSLPAAIIAKLGASGSRVEAGELLAYVGKWPTDYDHVHYNIYNSAGVTLNPEVYSNPVRDTTPPALRGAYALGRGMKALDVAEGATITTKLTTLVLATTDTKDGSVYVQAPPFVSAEFESGEIVKHDFLRALATESGSFPDIREVFASSVTTANDGRLTTHGNYGEGLFLVQLPVPPTARGRVKITIRDQAGNETLRTFIYRP